MQDKWRMTAWKNEEEHQKKCGSDEVKERN